MSAKDLVTSPKVVGTVITATAGAGSATYFSWLPVDIGIFASFVGIIFSIVLIIINIRRAKAEMERHEIQMRILQHEYEEMKKEKMVSDDDSK